MSQRLPPDILRRRLLHLQHTWQQLYTQQLQTRIDHTRSEHGMYSVATAVGQSLTLQRKQISTAEQQEKCFV